MKHKHWLSVIKQSDIFSHLTGFAYLPRWCVLLIDLLLCLMAYLLSMLIGQRLFSYGIEAQSQLFQSTLILLFSQTVFFWIFHTYSGILRYSTFVDATKVLFAVALNTAAMLLLNLILEKTVGAKLFMNSVLAIYFFVAFVFLLCLRIGTKTFFEQATHIANKQERVLIYGTHAAGLAISKYLCSSDVSKYRPIGFIIDQRDNQVRYLQGLPTYMLDDHLFPLMQERGIKSVIISPRKMNEINPQTDLQPFLQHQIRVLTAPDFSILGDEQDSSAHSNIGDMIAKISSIQVEDLLERPVININTDNVSQIISGNVVLITGAAGSIGSEIVRQTLSFNPRLAILLDQAETPLHELLLELRHNFPNAQIAPCMADVRSKERLEEVISQYKPSVIFHAAAYKHVPMMEAFPTEAIITNVQGTKNLADLAVRYGAKHFVMISTDKAVNPSSVMGTTKRIAEMYVQSLFLHLQQKSLPTPLFATTRFGNVLGSNGSVIPLFKKQIAAGGPVTVTHPDITRYFMTIPEACTLVLEAATLSRGGEIFVFDMGKPIKIADLARNMIQLAGLVPDKDVKIQYVGLRPGEKLYEELLNQAEKVKPTPNPKITIADVFTPQHEQLVGQVSQLVDLAREGKTQECIALMRNIVPEYNTPK